MVFFYAKYDYESPGLSGGGLWAYGSKPKGGQTSSASQEYWDANMRTDKKAASTNDDTKNPGQERVSRFGRATGTTSHNGAYTSQATSTVTQTEAHGHITSAHFDNKVEGLDSKLGKIQQMLLGSLDCQKDLQQYLKNSAETQSRLEATLDLGNQNTKLTDSLTAARDENVDLRLQIKGSERNHIIKYNNLEQDHRKAAQRHREQQRALEHRLEVARKDHEHALREAEILQENDVAVMKRHHDDLIREKTGALEKKSEAVRQLEGRLETLKAKLRMEHEDEVNRYQRDIQKLQEGLNGHLSEKTQLIQQHGEQVEALRATEVLLKKISDQQPSKDELQRTFEEQLKSLQVIESCIHKMDDRLVDNESDKQRREEQVKSLEAVQKQLEEINADQLDKDTALDKFKELTESLNDIEKKVQAMETRQQNEENETEKHEELVKLLHMVEQGLKEIDVRQLDKENAAVQHEEGVNILNGIGKQLEEVKAQQTDMSDASTTKYEEQVEALNAVRSLIEEMNARQLDKKEETAKYEEQMNLLNTIGKRLGEVNARQMNIEDTATRYEEQVKSLDAVKRRIEDMNTRQLNENAAARLEEQGDILNTIQKRLDGMDAQQLDKDDFFHKQDEEVQILGKIDNILTDMNNPEREAQKQKDHTEAFKAIETLIMSLDEHQPDKQFFEMKHEEQVQELRTIGDLLKNLSTQLPHNTELTQTHQEQMQALDGIEELVKSISTQHFAQRHEEQVKALGVIEDLLKEATAQQPNRELIGKHEEQLRKLKSLEDELKDQLEKIASAIDRFGDDQHGKERLERNHQEILEALERSHQVESINEAFKSQLAGIQQLLEKIDTQQETVQSVLQERPPQVPEETQQPNVLSEENAALLRRMREEKETIQQQFTAMSKRLEETTRALELAKDQQMQAAKVGKEALETSQASWIEDRSKLERRVVAATQESMRAQSETQNIQLEKDKLQFEWEKEKSKLAEAKSQLEAQVTELQHKMEAQEYGRRNLFEQVQQLRGNIRVMCRIRPPPPGTPQAQLVDFHPTRGKYVDHYQKVEVIAERISATGMVRPTSKFLECERVFTPSHTNRDVFEEVSQLTESAIDGKKVTIFCYGQTGSGKTFTMNHRVDPDGAPNENDGIIHQSLRMIFSYMNAVQDQYEYKAKMSIVEVYINDLIDLLHSSKKAVIKNMDEATENQMTSYQAVNGFIEKALDNRAVGATNANADSSRSHLVLCFKIQRKTLKGIEEGRIDSGILNLIDLAGSERNKETGATGQRLEESKAINGSIFELNQSITSLVEGKHRRPGHTLTRILDPCLARGCRVVMFVMVSPLKKDQAETENTMAKAEAAAQAKLVNKGSISPTSPGGGRSGIPVLKKDPAGARKGPARPKGK